MLIHQTRRPDFALAAATRGPLVRKYRRGFPGSLDGAPMLLPLEQFTLRRSRRCVRGWPAVVAISDATRHDLFDRPGAPAARRARRGAGS